MKPDPPDIEIPERLRSRPIDRRGFLVPFFVQIVNGEPDHRLADPQKRWECFGFNRCWLCGNPLDGPGAFVVGPMCTITRRSADPPSHDECARYAVRACPFLSRPHARRRDQGLAELGIQPAPGLPINRNPGVCAIWLTDGWRMDQVGAEDGGNPGFLFEFFDPISVTWWSEGDQATRREVIASLASGLPVLVEMAEQQDREDGTGKVAQLALAREIDRAVQYLPET